MTHKNQDVHEQDRLNALRAYNILDTLEEADFDELTQLASAICQVPIALISLVDEKRQWFKSHVGLAARETPIEQSFCAHAIAANELMIVEDATTDKRFVNNPLVTGDPHIVYYAGVPLVNEDGFGLGTLCVIDNKKHQLSDEQQRALKIIAKQVIGKMELRRKNELLKQTDLEREALNEELMAANEELNAAHESQSQLLNELIISEAKARTIFTNAPVAVSLLTGRSLIIDSANSMMLDIWGKSKAIIGLPLAKALPELEGQPFLEILDNVFISGEAYHGENSAVSLERGGVLEHNFYNFVYHPVKDEAGGTISIMVVANDVSEQVKSTQIVKESERKFRSLIEQAAIAVIVFRGEDLIIDAINPRMQQLLGKDGLLTGMPLLVAIPELMGQPPYELLYNVYKTGETYNGYETPVTLIRNGIQETGYFNFTYTPLIEGEEITGIIDMAVEVTDQVKANLLIKSLNAELSASEEKLQLLADNISQLAWMTDETGYIFWYNKRWFDYTGTNLEEMLGWGWEKVQHPDHLDRVVNTWSANVRSGKIFELTFPIKSKEGEFRWFLTRAVPLKDESGKIIRWFGTNTDVTEQKNDEQRKNDFIAMVSHELKTPLTSLNGYIQMLGMKAQKAGDEPALVTVERAKNQVGKMTKMINGFLNVSRLEAGKIHIDQQVFDMAVLVEDSEAETLATITSHKVIYAPVERTMVNADIDKIAQVVNNFISNAVKYSPPGSTIYVACETIENNARVCVRDEGMGIRESDIPKLFDRYYRVENENMFSIGGFGIGLYLCDEIIKRHGGKVWVKSELGKGSTFFFSIPLYL